MVSNIGAVFYAIVKTQFLPSLQKHDYRPTAGWRESQPATNILTLMTSQGLTKRHILFFCTPYTRVWPIFYGTFGEDYQEIGNFRKH